MCPLYTSLSFTHTGGLQSLHCSRTAGIQPLRLFQGNVFGMCVTSQPSETVLLTRPRLWVIQMKNKAFHCIGTPSFIRRWNVHCQTYHSYYGNHRANCRVVLMSLAAVIFQRCNNLHWGSVARQAEEKKCVGGRSVSQARRQWSHGCMMAWNLISWPGWPRPSQTPPLMLPPASLSPYWRIEVRRSEQWRSLYIQSL